VFLLQVGDVPPRRRQESQCYQGVSVYDSEDGEFLQLNVIFVVAVVMIRVRRQVARGADLFAPSVYANCGHGCQ
jgi:hypothetical protein